MGRWIYDGLECTLYRLTGEAHFGNGFVVEALHLIDGVMELVEISDEKFDNRRNKTELMLSGINVGNFPTEINGCHLSTLSALLSVRRRRRDL